MPMIWTTVAIADLETRPECAHRAYLDPEEEWNGWACPHFEKSEIERMDAWLPEFDDGLVYSPDEDTFTTTYDPEIPEVFRGEDIDGMHLYPVGNGSWTWVIIDQGAAEPEAGPSPDPDDPAQHALVD